jgi:hypothetical protein
VAPEFANLINYVKAWFTMHGALDAHLSLTTNWT